MVVKNYVSFCNGSQSNRICKLIVEKKKMYCVLKVGEVSVGEAIWTRRKPEIECRNFLCTAGVLFCHTRKYVLGAAGNDGFSPNKSFLILLQRCAWNSDWALWEKGRWMKFTDWRCEMTIRDTKSNLFVWNLSSFFFNFWKFYAEFSFYDMRKNIREVFYWQLLIFFFVLGIKKNLLKNTLELQKYIKNNIWNCFGNAGWRAGWE